MYTLLDIAANSSANNYLVIGIQLLFAVGFVGVMLFLSALVGPKRKTKDKLETFTSGIETHGDARQPMSVKYFLVAILFVLFDVEVIFFYPYAVNFRTFAADPTMGWSTFLAVLMFVGFFLAGFYYIIKKGALNWED
ncbi:MAG: NADH-quinone oxidoreductase subunit A [Chitinophagaceae bacterium]|nr:NADH-quinone oxidoreductase subunit A [Chitinophagaceae bacterium]